MSVKFIPSRGKQVGREKGLFACLVTCALCACRQRGSSARLPPCPSVERLQEHLHAGMTKVWNNSGVFRPFARLCNSGVLRPFAQLCSTQPQLFFPENLGRRLAHESAEVKGFRSSLRTPRLRQEVPGEEDRAQQSAAGSDPRIRRHAVCMAPFV